MKNSILLSLILILLSMLGAIGINAQKKSYDTKPYILEYHKKRLERFASEPVVTGNVIFLGDSITEFGDWKNLLNDITVTNRGIAGDNTFGVLDRLDEIISRKPSKLFIHIGINDISQTIPDQIIVENIYSIVGKIKRDSASTRIFVTSILPTNDSVKAEYPDAYNKNDHVVSINKNLKQNANKNGFVFIDLYKEISDKDGKLLTKYAENDGLHLNPEGYKLWIKLLKALKLVSISAFSQKQNEEVISVAKRMLEAQENYDSATLDKIYASDYMEISPQGEIDEREKAIGFYKVENAAQMKARTPKYILDEFNVRHYGKFSIVIARLSFGSKNDPNKAPMIAGRVVFALRQEKGAWKIYSAQFTPIPPPRPPANK